MERRGTNDKKILFFLVGLSAISLLVILVMGVIIPTINSFNTATILNVQVAPSDAIVTINDVDYGTGVHTNLAPGVYSARIHKDGFSEKTIEITIKDHKTTTILDYIVSNDEGLSYFEKNSVDLDILRNIKNDSTIEDFLRAYDRKLTISEKLPYTVYYGQENNTSASGSMARLGSLTITVEENSPKCQRVFCLAVNGSHANEDNATEVIKELDYNIADYEVIYENN